MGSWHLFTGVVTDNGNKGYHDCEQMTGYIFGSQNSSLFFGDAVKKEIILFGKGYWGNGDYQGMDTKYFDGMIDDVRIYNRPLSGQEIQALYDMTTPVKNEKKHHAKVIMNSAVHKNTLVITCQNQQTVDVTLVTLSGRLVLALQNSALNKGHTHLSVPTQLGAGLYLLHIKGRYCNQHQLIVIR